MSRQFNFEAFSRVVEQTAAAVAGEAGDLERLADAARAVQEQAEISLARHLSHDELIACGPGCGHCCILNVSLLLPEVHAICRYLKSKLDPPGLHDLHRQAAALDRRVGGLDDEERALARQECLFLDEQGSCFIYPVRPLLCRAITSTDPQQCQEALAMVALGESPAVVAHLFQQTLFNRAFLALGRALETVRVDSRSWRLATAIHTFLPNYL